MSYRAKRVAEALECHRRGPPAALRSSLPQLRRASASGCSLKRRNDLQLFACRVADHRPCTACLAGLRGHMNCADDRQGAEY